MVLLVAVLSVLLVVMLLVVAVVLRVLLVLVVMLQAVTGVLALVLLVVMLQRHSPSLALDAPLPLCRCPCLPPHLHPAADYQCACCLHLGAVGKGHWEGVGGEEAKLLSLMRCSEEEGNEEMEEAARVVMEARGVVAVSVAVNEGVGAASEGVREAGMCCWLLLEWYASSVSPEVELLAELPSVCLTHHQCQLCSVVVGEG